MKNGLLVKFLMLIALVIELFLLNGTEEAVASFNAHHHAYNRGGSVSRERESDGAYSPRGSSHSSKDADSHAHNAEFDHEAIVGSTKDAEEYHNLSPEEAKKRLKVLILKMDLDNNGQIEKNELKAWIIRSFRMLSEEESKDRFEEVDENNDGKVTWKEYVEETFGLDVDDTAIPLENIEEVQMMKDDKALFSGADKNKDGFLDEKEYLAFSHPEEDPQMLPIVLQQTLEEKDKNRDGHIDFQEYIGDRAQDKDTAWLEEEKSKFDMELDKNGDGLLNRQEILSWVIPSNEEIAEEEVSHLFSGSDDDNDGKLSYDEILDHHDLFVGSDATDYGEHLHNLDKFRDEL